MTVANLGLAVDSGQVDQGTIALTKLSAAAKATEVAANSLAGKTTAAAGAAKTLATSADAEATALTKAAAAARSAANANEQFARSVGKAKVETANIAAQLNDIGVQLAGGTSPFLIAIQQGTQLNQVLGQGGVRAAVGALGGAFMSLLNPVSLLTIGVIGLGGTAVQYFVELISGSEKSAEELKKQADLIQAVADRWGDALPAVRAYLDELDNAREMAELLNAGETVAGSQYDVLRQTVAEFAGEIADLQTDLSGFGLAASDELANLQAAFANLQTKVADNTATAEDAQAVQEALAAVFDQQGIPAANRLAAAFGDMATTLLGVSAAAQKARNDVGGVLAIQDLGPLGTISPVYSSGGKFIDANELQDVRANATKSQYQLEQERLAKSLRKSSAKAEDPWKDMRTVSQSAREELQKLERQTAQTERAWERFGQGAIDIFGGLVTGTMDWKQALQAALPLLTDLITKLLEADKLGGGGGLGGFLGGLFGGGGGGFSAAAYAGIGQGLYAKGGVFDQSGVTPFAKGGVVNGPTIFPFAKGVGLMGEAGPEAIMPLTRDGQGRLGVRAGGGSGNGSPVNVKFEVINQSGAKVEQQQSKGPDGETIIRAIVRDEQAKSLPKSLSSGFGITPKVTRRS